MAGSECGGKTTWSGHGRGESVGSDRLRFQASDLSVDLRSCGERRRDVGLRFEQRIYDLGAEILRKQRVVQSAVNRVRNFLFRRGFGGFRSRTVGLGSRDFTMDGGGSCSEDVVFGVRTCGCKFISQSWRVCSRDISSRVRIHQ